jgi:hypothetical protein
VPFQVGRGLLRSGHQQLTSGQVESPAETGSDDGPGALRLSLAASASAPGSLSGPTPEGSCGPGTSDRQSGPHEYLKAWPGPGSRRRSPRPWSPAASGPGPGPPPERSHGTSTAPICLHGSCHGGLGNWASTGLVPRVLPKLKNSDRNQESGIDSGFGPARSQFQVPVRTQTATTLGPG